MLVRRVLIQCVRFATALALLVAVIGLPIRPVKSAVSSSCFKRPRRNFSVPTTGSTRLSGTSVVWDPMQVLPNESDEELSWATRPECFPLVLPPVAPPKPEPDWAASGDNRAIHPLRC